MGKTRYKWWGYVKAVLRAYPGYCKALGELKSPAITPRYGGAGGGGDGTLWNSPDLVKRSRQIKLLGCEGRTGR